MRFLLTLLSDFMKVSISIAIVAIVRMKFILYSAAPYLALCTVFAAYVVGNSGVVLGKFTVALKTHCLYCLGDKSNHVATVHIPQMLYIWPYTAFFSFPLLIPILSTYVLKISPTTLLTYLGHRLPNIDRYCGFEFPRLKVYLILIILSVMTVHFNTIVHPFTLADNRHYVFYVFRILRWHPYVKYLAASVCIVCAHICILAMGCITPRKKASKQRRTTQPEEGVTSLEHTSCDNGQYVSLVIIWLTASSLSVISAPLVEPRYFILPWIFWRLNVHSHGNSTSALEAGPHNQKPNLYIDVDRSNNLYLWMETGWYLAINAITGYVFLYRGFEWTQEAGAVQRFMW